MNNPARILFYVQRSLHLPFLEPIHDYLQANKLALTAFCAPEYFEGDETLPGWGLYDSEIKRLRDKSLFYSDPEAFQPDVTIVADACHSCLPFTKIINVGHGMICKGSFYTEGLVVRRENLSEMLLVPGSWHKRRMRNDVFIPMKTTGFIKSDQLFGQQTVSREQFCQQKCLDPDKKIILFAPTYNPELSAIPFVREEIQNVATEDRILLIKLHNLTSAPWKETYSNIAAKHQNILYLEDKDYSGMMQAADLLISDVSSIFIEFILLDKPVILYNNPALQTFVYYRADDIEYQTRNAAHIVNSTQELFSSVEKQLKNPEMLSSKRKQYAKALNYKQDGKSAQRAAEAIIDWFNGKIKPNFPKAAIVILQDKEADSSQIIADIREAQNKNNTFDPDIFVFGGKDNLDMFESELKFKKLANLNDLLNQTKAEYLLFMHGAQKLPQNILKYLYLHFLWNNNVAVVKTINQHEVANQVMQRITESDIHISDPEIASFGLLTTAIGQSIAAEYIHSTCMMSTRKNISALLHKDKSLDKDTIFEKISNMAVELEQKVLLAADCFVWKR